MVSAGAESNTGNGLYINTGSSVVLESCYFNPCGLEMFELVNVAGFTAINCDGETTGAGLYAFNHSGCANCSFLLSLQDRFTIKSSKSVLDSSKF